MDSTIRNSKGTALNVTALMLALALPLVGFGLLVAQVPNRAVNWAVHTLAMRNAAAEPAQPMVFGGETITLAEADAAWAAAERYSRLRWAIDAANRRRCALAMDEVACLAVAAHR